MYVSDVTQLRVCAAAVDIFSPLACPVCVVWFASSRLWLSSFTCSLPFVSTAILSMVKWKCQNVSYMMLKTLDNKSIAAIHDSHDKYVIEPIIYFPDKQHIFSLCIAKFLEITIHNQTAKANLARAAFSTDRWSHLVVNWVSRTGKPR